MVPTLFHCPRIWQHQVPDQIRDYGYLLRCSWSCWWVCLRHRDPPMEALLPLTGQGGLFSPRGEIIEHTLGTCRLMQCSRWPDPEVKCPGSKWGLPPPNPSCLGGVALPATSPAPASSGLAPASVGLIPSWFCRRPTAALGVF